MANYDVTRHGYTLRLQITETATNVETNKSTISYKLMLISGNQYHFENFGVGAEIKFDGTTIASRNRATSPQLSIGFNSTLTLLSGSTSVSHASDGTKSIALAFSLDMADYYYTPGPMSGSGTFACATIPRATTPTLSAATVNLGSEVTISVAGRASSGFSHVISATISGGSVPIGTISASANPQSIAWTPANELANTIRNSRTKTIAIVCVTKQGSTTIGTKSADLTLNVPNTNTFKPAAVVNMITEQDATVQSLFPLGTRLVQGKSKITVVGYGSGKYNATIKSIAYAVNGVDVDPPENVPITASGSIPIKVTVTDERGLSGSSTETKTSLAYAAPKASGVKFQRADILGNADPGGEYLKIKFNATISSLDGQNANSYAVHVQKAGTSTWTSITSGTGTSISVNSVSSSAVLDADYSYTVRLRLTDSWGDVDYFFEIGTGYTTVDYRNTGKGIAFGKVSEKDAFEVNMDVDLKKTLQKNGTDVDLCIGRGYDSTTGFFWRKWSSGLCELWASVTDHPTSSTAISGTGSTYYSEQLSHTLPFSIYEAVITGTCNHSGYITATSWSGSTITYRIARGVDITSEDYTTRLHIIGRWTTFSAS